MVGSEVPQLFDIPAAAARLGVSPVTLRKYIRDGRIRRLKLGPGRHSGRVRIEAAELQRFVETLRTHG